ncbi:unnamed protein product [Phytomonas sp. Hart1]|nr:unnamed protein product [Phytomonas sp. Hart1]|eukprot:CCW67753.1 unnamed protein product [Phytomonas sp. isolate Hart1]
MTLLACVLHSSDGNYEDLVSSVVSCITSIFYSVSALSPDFVPQIAIFRSDPLVGCHCLYRSTVSDCNHTVKAPSMPFMAFSPTFHSYEACRQQQQHLSSDELNEDLFTVFRGRSASYLSECILLGTRALPSRMKENFNTTDVWGSLAGGLLASLAFFNKHKLESYQPSTQNDTNFSNTTTSSGTRPILLVFSNSTQPYEVTYSTECAMAVAAVTATRLNTVAFAFGKAASEEQADVAGCSRVQAFAIVTGGFCAERFCPSLIGGMLDKSFSIVFDERSMHNVREGSDLTHSLRGKRDQMAKAYVVAPPTMPQCPQSGLNRESSTISSHLAWLCPRCMTITYRASGEDISSNSNIFIDENDNTVAFCQYCDKL